MKHHYERGAVLVETTIIVTFMLTIVLFALELGLLGFLQVTADAAAFFDAHENIVGTSNGLTPEQTTGQTFKGLASQNVTAQAVPAPTPSIAVNYGYNDPNQNQATVANNRHGGVSMMQPVQEVSTVNNAKAIPLIGKGGVGVTSQETEAKWTECGPHYNVVNENYDCGDPNAPAGSAVSFQNGEYTAPYYVGYNFFTRCEDPQPWGDESSGLAVTYETNCSQTQLDSMGMAEYLYNSNWGANNPGVSGSIGSSTFQAMACHQRIFASIASFLSNYPKLSNIYSTPKYLSNLQTMLLVNRNFSDFRNWVGFDDGGSGTTVDNEIQSVYDWDVYIDTGYPPTSYTEPGTYPLNPLGNNPNTTSGTRAAPVSC